MALLVLVAPWLAGLGVVRRAVADRLGAAIGRDVTLGGVSAGWFSGVTVSDVTVAGRRWELGDEPLLRVSSVRVENSLPGLLFGSGALQVVVDGLEVRVDAMAGGQTSVDDLVARLTAPRPPPPRPPPKVPPRGVAVRVTGATVRVAVVPHQPPAERFDPLATDPPVKPATEGALVLGVERFDAAFGDGHLRLGGGVRLGGEEATVEADLAFDAAGPRGTVRAKGLDLDLLGRVLPVASIGGTVDLEAEGDLAGAGVTFQLRATGLALALPDFAPLKEEWLEARGRVRREGAAFALEEVALRSASESLSLDAAGVLPPGEGQEFHAQGQAAARTVGFPGQGTAVFDLTARGGAEGLDLTGTAGLHEFRFDDSSPAWKGTGHVDATLDARLGPERVTIRTLQVKGKRIDLALSGDVSRAPPFTGDLQGRLDAQLRIVHALLRRFVGAPAGSRLAGDARVPEFVLHRDAAGNLKVKADVLLDDLLVQGYFADEVRLPHSELHVDAAMEEDGDVLRVTRAQLDDLAAHGRVAGLRGGTLTAVEGSVKGTLVLNPLLTRVAGVRAITGLGGVLTVDAQAHGDAADLEMNGTLGLDDFHLTTALGTMKRKRVDLRGRLARKDGALDGTLDGSSSGFTLAAQVAGGSGWLTLEVAELEDSVLLMAHLPAGVEVSGPATLHVEGARTDGGVRGTVQLSSPGLTARAGEDGLAGDPVDCTVTVETGAPDGLHLGIPALALPSLDTTLTLAEGRLYGSTFSGHLGGLLALDRIAERVAAARPFAPQGQMTIEGDVAFDLGWTFDGTVAVTGLAFTAGGQRLARDRLEVALRGDVEPGGGVSVERLRLDGGGLVVEGAGTFAGRDVQLAVQASGTMEQLASLVPDVGGTGEFRLDDGLLHVRPDGVEASGRLYGYDVRAAGVHALRARVKADVDAGWVDGRLRLRKADVLSTCVHLTFDTLVVDDVILRHTGTREEIDGTLKAKRLRVGEVVWDGVELRFLASLDELLHSGETHGVHGTLTFDHWQLGPFPWKNGKGNYLHRGDRVELRGFTATIAGGAAQLDATLYPTPEHIAWETEVKVRGIALDTGMADPLSFLVPVLRLGRKEESRLSGTLDVELAVNASDTTDAAILQTMAGRGKIGLRDVSVSGSIILPLLSLRIDKVLGGSPYTFTDVTIPFEVGRGKLRPQPFKLRGHPFNISIRGEAELDGHIDFIIAPTLLPIPLGVRGPIDAPSVRAAPFSRIFK